MVEETCKNCRYFKVIGKYETLGECHRYPPVYNEGEMDLIETSEHNWCGEWKQK